MRIKESDTWNLISKCTALMFVDLSFTSFLDLKVLLPLGNLKALILGGVRVNDFSTLSYFEGLEVLSLRNCQGLEHLEDVKDLVTLRALDIGHCPKILSISSLQGLTRLEELVIDSCGLQSAAHVPPSIASISMMTQLRLLNVQQTALMDHRDSLLDIMCVGSVIEG